MVLGVRMGWISCKKLGLAVAAGVLAASGAQAQDAAPVCEAGVGPLEEGGEAYLRVACGGKGVILGQVDDYQLVQLPSLGSTVALTTLEGSRRAWLIMKDDKGDLALEEITGTIARLAGRGARRDIDGLELDFSQINTGQLTAAIRSPNGGAAGLDLAAMVERSRAVRNTAASGDAN